MTLQRHDSALFLAMTSCIYHRRDSCNVVIIQCHLVCCIRLSPGDHCISWSPFTGKEVCCVRQVPWWSWQIDGSQLERKGMLQLFRRQALCFKCHPHRCRTRVTCLGLRYCTTKALTIRGPSGKPIATPEFWRSLIIVKISKNCFWKKSVIIL